MGEGAGIAHAAAGVGLAGEGEGGSAGFSDLSGDEVHGHDEAVGGGALGLLVDAHSPDGHGSW